MLTSNLPDVVDRMIRSAERKQAIAWAIVEQTSLSDWYGDRLMAKAIQENRQAAWLYRLRAGIAATTA